MVVFWERREAAAPQGRNERLCACAGAVGFCACAGVSMGTGGGLKAAMPIAVGPARLLKGR